MKAILNKTYLSGTKTFDTLLETVKWENKGAPRMEAFMSDVDLSYGYDTKFGVRYYNSIPFTDEVKTIMNNLNEQFNTEYNVCFLNYYENEKQHLGWHADDSPEMDTNHPIAVISFGESRYIFVKDRFYKGEIPDEDKFLLNDGSLFIMPANYQEEH